MIFVVQAPLWPIRQLWLGRGAIGRSGWNPLRCFGLLQVGVGISGGWRMIEDSLLWVLLGKLTRWQGDIELGWIALCDDKRSRFPLCLSGEWVCRPSSRVRLVGKEFSPLGDNARSIL